MNRCMQSVATTRYVGENTPPPFSGPVESGGFFALTGQGDIPEP